ncbi:hypothetical protein DSLASN_26430 [Desulfoluna limicola]|uniref:Uncharacterized protein n=1 Tax=Desulfoluna limicola TaxID=2810562 RepID=A0ABN6F657_9BACT|nr:hypothetical protein [Desulfoluna limicola]BCS97011.1 hypothetical protein DSLASN_26430 [Desulfoluna limicola]
MTKRESKVMRSFQIKMMAQLAQGKFDSVDLKNDLFVKWLVSHMAESRIPFKLIPLGGGVTRIVHSGGLCPLCCGTGTIHADEPELVETPDPVSLIPSGEAISCCGGNCTCRGGCADGGVCCKSRRSAA